MNWLRRLGGKSYRCIDKGKKNRYCLGTLIPDRLRAGHQVLVLGIGVRIPVREPPLVAPAKLEL